MKIATMFGRVFPPKRNEVTEAHKLAPLPRALSVQLGVNGTTVPLTAVGLDTQRLRFISKVALPQGRAALRIPFRHQRVLCVAEVTWTRPAGDDYEGELRLFLTSVSERAVQYYLRVHGR